MIDPSYLWLFMRLLLPNYFKYSAKLLGLTAVNIAGATLGKLMAIPPGNVTPLWPPSGIAFAALLLWGKQYWPAVLLGSLCFNCTFFYQQHHFLRESDFLCSLVIAAGSTLQAIVGVCLAEGLSHEKPENWPLETFLRALLKAGPIACCIAATLGVFSLWLSGSILNSDLFNTWVTWWFGDTSGVLIMGGLIVAIARQYQKPESEDSAPKIRMIRVFSIILLLLVIGSSLAFWRLLRVNRIEAQTLSFHRLSKQTEQNLNERFSSYQNVLLDIATIRKTNPYISSLAWQQYLDALDLKKRYPALLHVTYIPKDSPALASLNFRKSLSQDAFKGIEFTRQTTSCCQEYQGERGYWVWIPVYSLLAKTKPLEAQGYVTAFLLTDTLFQNLIQVPSIDLSIYDTFILPENRIFSTAELNPLHKKLRRHSNFSFGNRRWILAWESSTDWHDSSATQQEPYVLFLGLFSGLLLTFLLLNLNGSREKALAMVRKATQELEAKNLLLEQSNEELAQETRQANESKQIIKHISRRNELILNAMTEGIFGYGEDSSVLFINNSATEMLGCTVEQVLETKNNHALFHHTRADGSPYPPEECRILEAVTAGKVVHVTDEVFWRLDGTSFPVEYSAIPFFQDGVFEGVVIVFRDITEKLNQDKLLKEASMRFQAVFNQSFQFTGLVSPEGDLLDANQSALAVSGIKPDDVFNKPLWETPWWDHSLALQEKVKTAVQKAREKEFVRFEMFHYDASGEAMSIDFSMKPLLDDAGEVIMLIAEGRDITYIKKIEQEHRDMVVKLKETVAMRRTFVSTLTHDLRTPLIAQGRVLQSLQNEKVITQDARLVELIKGFIQNNNGLLLMISNLLETYELEDGRMRLMPESLSLYELTMTCKQELQELLNSRNIILDIEIPEFFPRIQADALLVKRILQNLIGNAIANISNGSHIWINVEDWDNFVDISVQDNGPGIPEDVLPYLFSRYLLGHSTRKKIGSGLGLYICKMISELHGGTIRVDSVIGSGTKISFTLLKEIASNDAGQAGPSD